MKKLLFTFCLLSIFITSNINGQSEYPGDDDKEDFVRNGLEVQTRPLRIIFGSPNVGFEWVNNDNLGVSINAGTQLNSVFTSFRNIEAEFYLIAVGKFYMQPKYGSDGFYIGGYGRYFYQETALNFNGNNQTTQTTRAALGFAVGYKWMSESRITFDVGTGLGRNIVDRTTSGGTINTNNILDGILGISVIGNATIGYRFYQI